MPDPVALIDDRRQRLVDLVHVEVDDLDAALAAVEEIQSVAQADRDLVIEGCALVHASWTHLLRGDFASAGFCLDRAEDVFAETAVDGLWEPPLLHACRGALHAWRGEAGAPHFERAQRCAQEAGTPAGAAVSAALQADVDGGTDAPAEAPGGHGVEPMVGWAVVWARRGLAARALAAGDLSEAAELLDGLLAQHDGEERLNPVERGRTLVLQGEVQLRRGDAPAVPTLREAATLLEGRGARYPATRALLLLAEAEDDAASAADALARARALSSSDPAFRALWELRPRLEVGVLGGQAVRLGEEPIALSKNAAQLVHLLAFAGPHGRHWERVADQLWPHVLDAQKAASNVTSLTRNTRARLGAEAWRLRREGPMLFFDLDHGTLDLADAVATADWCLGADPPRAPDRLAHALVLLRRPVLPAWSDAPWVREVDAWRAERLAAVTALLGGRADWGRAG